MKSIVVVSIVASLFTAAMLTTPSASEPDPATPPPPAPAATIQPAAGDSLAPDSSLVFKVEIGNRMFPDWREEQRVRLGEPFHLGDTENWATAPVFLPDFRIVDKKVISASRAWNNPALRIMVYNDSTAIDSSWAFRDFPPHYSQHSFFTFKLLEIVVSSPESGAR